MLIKIWTFGLLLALTACVVPGTGQNKEGATQTPLAKKEQKWLEEAKQKQRKGELTKAMELYDKILEKRPDAIDAILAKSGIYYRQNNFTASSEMLITAMALDPEYDKEIYYSMAIISEKLEDYKSADAYMQQYIDRSSDREKKYLRAINLQKRFAFIAEAIQNPVPFNPSPLPATINTLESEYTPGISADGSQFYFVRRISNQEDILVSRMENEDFSMPELVKGILTKDNEGVFALSPDGSTIIFTACNRREGLGSCDLYYTKKNKYGNWASPSNMGKKVNSVGWDSQPSLSADGNTLYFSSRRYGSIGHSDLWVTSWTREDGWSIPENLGGMINTTGSDETPFIHPDGKTLYFRSNAREGMGDFDIYISRYDDDLKEWGEPKNLGYPINTTGSEGGLIVSLDGMKAYYSSDNGTGNVDIYSFELYPEVRPFPSTYVKVNVIDEVSKEPLEVEVIFDNQSDRTSRSTSTDFKGNALLAFPAGYKYGITIQKEGYIFYSDYFDIDSITTSLSPYILNVALVPIEEEELVVEKPIILNNIFFESGSAVLQETSYPEINRLLELLKSGTQYNVTIIGHTDNVGQEVDNLKLSSDRAKSVYDALVKGGISPQRITFVGKGENEPISSNDSPDGRRKNRRTEFLLSKK